MIPFVQSSDTGKPRVADEVAKHRMTLLINIGQDSSPGHWSEPSSIQHQLENKTDFLAEYPPPDISVRKYIYQMARDSTNVCALYVAFLRALFQEALVLMQMEFNDATPLSLQWYEYMQIGISHDSQGPRREDFYEKGVATVPALVRNLCYPPL